MNRRIPVLLLIAAILASALTVAGPVSAQEGGDVQEKFVSAYQSATTLEELQFAPDFTTEHASVLRLYQAFFNRQPDLGGAKYWMTQWDRVRSEGVTDRRGADHDFLGEFSGHFTLGQEFISLYAGVNNTEFLTRVYQNMLGREPDAGGFSYWLSFLEGTNQAQPGVVLSRGDTIRWVTQNPEFVGLYPFGHIDRSPHPSDNADCTLDNVEAFANQTITGIYRLRDGAIRELCYGIRDEVVENAWSRLVQIADPSHHSPVALLAVYVGNGAGVVAYAGPSTSNGSFTEDVWLIGAQDAASRNDAEADLTMSHELTHVFTQLDDQIDFTSSNLPELNLPSCGGRLEAFEVFCFQPNSLIQQWVDTFWSADELAVWGTNTDVDQTNNVNTTSLCQGAHDFAGTYATTSPYEDFAEAFSAYVHGVDKPNLTSKFAFFDARPVLQAYRSRATAAGRTGYADTFGDCFSSGA